ncbi:hypothetical protein T484DRAFT_1815329 [Baffinella frigidus]|nr:hypothetical protein T484DRAFT_1815329 [Cryptophyta sp. CCMP2293]
MAGRMAMAIAAAALRPGEHCSGLRSAFALTVVPARRLPLLSLGGGARSAGARVADALALSAMELDTLITQSRNARELMELVQQHGQKFTAINLSAAWGTVTGMQSARGGGDEGVVLQLLQVLTRAKMHEMGAREVANVAHSVASLKVSGRMGVDDELAGELQARATATAGEFEPQDVSMLMLALAKMYIRPDTGLLEAMQQRATATAGHFTPQIVSTLMSALSKMGITNPDAGLVEAMQGRARETAGDFIPQNVANLMLALAKMGIKPDAGLLEAMQERAKKTAGDFTPRDVSMLMSALSKMFIKNPDAGLVEAMQGRARETAGDFEPQSVSMLMLALAKMGIKPDAGLLEVMQARARETAVNCKPREVQMLRQAFATMGITPDAGLLEAMPARVGPREGAPKELKEPERHVSSRPSGSHLGKLTTEIVRCRDAGRLLGLVAQHGQSFTAINLSAAWGTVTGMQSARGGGDEGVVLQLLQVLTRAKMHEMGAREVANVAHSVASLKGSGRMGVDGALEGELQARARETAGDFTPHEFSMFMSAMEKMGLVEAMQGRATAAAGEL